MHTHQTVIRLQHTDAAGVMFFLRIFELAHTAYEELLEEVGHPIPRDMPGAPYIIPIVHTEADYRASLRIGDRVTVQVVLTKLRARAFTVAYRVEREDGELAATVQTVHVVVDPGTGRAMSMPEDLRTALAAHLVPTSTS